MVASPSEIDILVTGRKKGYKACDMQSSTTLLQLAQSGQKLRQQNKTWDNISITLNILTADCRPNPGLAKRIVDQGYEPRRVETQHRLGLPLICPSCRRRVPRPRQYHSLFDYPEQILRRMLEEREEF